MLFPTAENYRLSIINPALCLSDGELKHGEFSRSKNGMPLIWSGAFTSVFRVVTERGLLAVRCFLRQINDDQQERYRLLANYLGDKSAPMFVNFEYQPNGILVNGKWYPIVKMEWVEGLHLDEKIQELISNGDTKKLDELASQWLHLIISLHKLGIAHGDLSNGNILVTEREIRLIDYDSVFVPTLTGKTSSELGHPNFQHPNRNINSFNANTGDFSALVIYLSLLAISKEPSLWAKFHRDKNLLFSSDDFKSPKEAPIFAALKNSDNKEIRDLALKLETICLTSETPINFSSLLSTESPPTVKTNALSIWVKNNTKLITPAVLGGILTTLVSVLAALGSSILLLPKISPIYLVFGLIGVILVLVLLVGTIIYRSNKAKQQKVNSRIKIVDMDLFTKIDNDLSSLLK